jgi:tetratricopeptide (TPR) repeat protein
MKSKKMILIAFFTAMVIGLSAASQALDAEGSKNLRSANMHLGGGRYEKALPLYEQVLEQNPHHIEAIRKIGGIYFDVNKDYHTAYIFFVKALNEIDDVYSDYESMLSENEKEAQKFYKSEIDKPKLAKAKEELNKLKHDAWALLFNSAKEAFDSENYQKALKLYLEMEDLTPDSLKVLKMISYAYNLLEQKDESFEYMLKIAEIDENDDFVRTNIGNIYYERKEFEKAIEWYRNSAEIDPQVIDNYYNMALAYNQLKDIENTLWAWEKVHEIDPNDIDVVKNISNIAATLDQIDKSLDFLKKAIALEPENEETVKFLTYKLVQEKRFKEALEYAQKWKEINPESEEANQMINYAKQNLK